MKVMGKERQNCRVVGRGREGDGRGRWTGQQIDGKGAERERESCEVLTKRQGWVERAAKRWERHQEGKWRAGLTTGTGRQRKGNIIEVGGGAGSDRKGWKGL